jgi:hypothetical protein
VKRKSFTAALLCLVISNVASSSEIVVKEYCTYKRSAKALTVNMPLVVNYGDGFKQNTQLFVSCFAAGTKCEGFYSAGEHFTSRVFRELKIKHMGVDSVVLINGDFDEFLLDVKSGNFRWRQVNTGRVSEGKCKKVLSE